MRTLKSPSDLLLPPSPIPRTGDAVVWYVDAGRMEGVLEGHKPDGKPCVRSTFGNVSILNSFDELRLADPSRPLGPAWLRLPEQAVVAEPTAEEAASFGELLAQHIPPGPTYAELITEIWSRGFEVFVVGGTVRDVVAGRRTNDVDLVTTMPLERAHTLLSAMYRRAPAIDGENGFVRLGGGSGDPFIDLKMFSEENPGTPHATFGSSFVSDVAHRDFACNAIYYDPVNQIFIDPSGRGIVDAEGGTLHVVCNKDRRNAFHRARLVIRFFKFVVRGFNPDGTASDQMRDSYLPSFPAMGTGMRIDYVRTQLLSKEPVELHSTLLDQLRCAMTEFGAGSLWDEYLAPYVEDILNDRAPH